MMWAPVTPTRRGALWRAHSWALVIVIEAKERKTQVKFNDLRDFLTAIDELGQLKVVEGASCDLEIGAITEVASFKKSCPAVLFDSIKGFPKGYRVLTNFAASSMRERMVFGVATDLSDPEAVLYWKNRMKEYAPVEPIAVKDGAVKENVMLGDDVDLTRFPWPKWHQ